MTRADLIESVSHKKKMTWLQAEILVGAIFDCMEHSLVRGERIEVRGFGTFHARNYKGYRGRNPKTGNPVEVPPKRLPFFKASKNLAADINAGRKKNGSKEYSRS
jgi:integration host factor subunit beta